MPAADERTAAAPERHAPRLLTTQGRLLVILAERPDLRLWQIAEAADVTPRTVTTTLAELEEAGLLERRRQGRNNVYRVTAPGLLRSLRELEEQLATATPCGTPS